MDLGDRRGGGGRGELLRFWSCLDDVRVMDSCGILRLMLSEVLVIFVGVLRVGQ